MRKLIGLRKYTNITLKRGYTQDTDAVGAGTRNIVNGVPDRRNGTIVLHERGAARTCCAGASRTPGSTRSRARSFKASGNEVAIESVELVHEGLTIELA